MFIVVRMIDVVIWVVDIFVIGMGGVMISVDVFEFMMVGVLVVGVGIVNFIDLLVCFKIINGFEFFMDDLSIVSFEDFWI